jgi:hypothetical protein
MGASWSVLVSSHEEQCDGEGVHMAHVGEGERCVEGFCGKCWSSTPLGISRLK